MEILLKWLRQQPCLDSWEKRPFSPSVERGPGAVDQQDTYVREVAIEEPGPPVADGPHRRLATAILGYRIFPPGLVSGVLRREPVEIGDTVGITYHLLPGVDLFFAARVVDRFDELRDGIWRTGFTYRTLAGHPELGEETFSVEKDVGTGRVRVALRSWSRPGIWLAWGMYPLTRLFQFHASHAALGHLANQARGNPAGSKTRLRA